MSSVATVSEATGNEPSVAVLRRGMSAPSPERPRGVTSTEQAGVLRATVATLFAVSVCPSRQSPTSPACLAVRREVVSFGIRAPKATSGNACKRLRRGSESSPSVVAELGAAALQADALSKV